MARGVVLGMRGVDGGVTEGSTSSPSHTNLTAVSVERSPSEFFVAQASSVKFGQHRASFEHGDPTSSSSLAGDFSSIDGNS